MEVLVFVEPAAGGYRAMPMSSAELVGTGRTEADAVIELTTRLRAGRVLRVDIPDPPVPYRRDPVVEAALDGLAAAPPEIWQAYHDGVAERRQQADEEEDARLRAEDAARATPAAGPAIAAPATPATLPS